MLAARNLSFRYHDRGPTVLNNASLSLAPGEVVGLAGSSGEGKSTLARILAGYLAPQAGDVTLDGKPISAHGPHPVQLLFQTAELAVNPRWTIETILTEARPRDAAIWDRFGIQSTWLGRYPHELSGGELQRVAIVRTLTPSLRYLIADEISGMLDTVTQAEIWRALLSHATESNVGILAISHDAALLSRISSRLLSMAGGSIASLNVASLNVASLNVASLNRPA